MSKNDKAYDFNNFENDKLSRPRDEAWTNFVKWTEEGQKVQGFIRDVFYRPEEKDDTGAGFGEQRGIVLEQADGVLCIVTVKRLPFILSKTDNLRLGDPLTVVFEKTLPPQKKGWNGVKQFSFYGKNLEENKDQKTVKELEEEDIKAGGTSNKENNFDEVVNSFTSEEDTRTEEDPLADIK